MKKKKICILLTSIGGEMGPQLINCFRNTKVFSKIKIIGIDKKKNVTAKFFLDNYYQVPSANSNKYIKKVKKIIKSESVNLIIPLSDEESLSISKNLSDYQNLVIASSPYHILKVLSNKIETYKILEKNGIKTPLWFEIKSSKELKIKMNLFRLKKKNYCLKPSVSRGGRDVFIVNDKLKKKINFQGSREVHLNSKIFLKEYLSSLKNKYPLIIMEKLKEPVYDLDILSNRGKTVTYVARRRINSALPNEGHVIVNSTQLKKIAFKLSKIFDLNYLHDCDLMLDNNKKFKILEINPRPSGSFSIGVEAGVPLTENILKLYQGLKIKKTTKKLKKKVIPYKKLLSI